MDVGYRKGFRQQAEWWENGAEYKYQQNPHSLLQAPGPHTAHLRKYTNQSFDCSFRKTELQTSLCRLIRSFRIKICTILLEIKQYKYFWKIAWEVRLNKEQSWSTFPPSSNSFENSFPILPIELSKLFLTFSTFHNFVCLSFAEGWSVSNQNLNNYLNNLTILDNLREKIKSNNLNNHLQRVGWWAIRIVGIPSKVGKLNSFGAVEIFTYVPCTLYFLKKNNPILQNLCILLFFVDNLERRTQSLIGLKRKEETFVTFTFSLCQLKIFKGFFLNVGKQISQENEKITSHPKSFQRICKDIGFIIWAAMLHLFRIKNNDWIMQISKNAMKNKKMSLLLLLYSFQNQMHDAVHFY